MRMVYKCITGISRPVVKTPALSALPFLLRSYSISQNLYMDENTKLIIFKILPRKFEDELPRCAIHKIPSQISRLCLPLNVFFLISIKFREHSHAGLHMAQNNSNVI